MISKADVRKDMNDVLELWENNCSGIPKEKYEWMYKNNPSGPASCWLIKQDEKVIGSTALFPRRLFINGQPVTGGIGGDLFVKKEQRGLGLALSMQKEVISSYAREGFDILYGFPNNKSEGLLRKQGYFVLGNVISLTKPLKSYPFLKKSNLPVIPEVLSKPLDFTMRILSKERYYARPKNISPEVLSRFDSRFDILWEKALSQFTIIGERTSSYLTWRYMLFSIESYSIFTIKHISTNEILGYIVFSIAQNKVNIMDILYVDVSTLDILLPEFFLFLRNKDVESISIKLVGNTGLISKLQRYRFFIRDDKDKCLGFFLQDSPYSKYFTDINNWYLVPGDNDA